MNTPNITGNECFICKESLEPKQQTCCRWLFGAKKREVVQYGQDTGSAHHDCVTELAQKNACYNCGRNAVQIQPSETQRGYNLYICDGCNRANNTHQAIEVKTPLATEFDQEKSVNPQKPNRTKETEKEMPLWQVPIYVITSIVAIILVIILIGIPAVCKYGNSDQSKEEISDADKVQKKLETVLDGQYKYHKMDGFEHYSHTVMSTLIHLLPPDPTTIKNLGEVIKHEGEFYLKTPKPVHFGNQNDARD